MEPSFNLDAASRNATAFLSRSSSRVLAPHVILRFLAILLLLAIWGTTLGFINSASEIAERTAATSTGRLADIYEAQVARALREIDQTLRVVKYAHDMRGNDAVLQELQGKGLLLPNLWFTLSIANEHGDVVASTNARDQDNVTGRDYFEQQRHRDSFFVGLPDKNPDSNQWMLHFSRRLSTADGKFSGIELVTVFASYFVSSYEPTEMGEHGVLGIFGLDGIFQVRRSGDIVSAGERFNYRTLIKNLETTQEQATLSTNAWDGVRRYTSVRKLYGFPVAVVVGLSAKEQLAATRRNITIYVWRAVGASALLILIVAILDRMSRQLALSRQRAVEEQIAHAKHVEHLAYHDSLTTLPNRSLFSKLLAQNIRQAKRNNRQLALLFLDVDRFKQINDTLGHEAGDQLLRELALRLKGCLRESDTVARLGGDEFVVLLPELHDQTYAATVAHKILAAVAQPFSLLGQVLHVTTSIGISTYPRAGLDEQTLTKSADVAMYQAKANGKNNFQFYSEELSSTSLQRLNLESALRQALNRKEFRLHYQTRQDIDTGKITGMEALLRWEHPDMGMVAPMQFIPVAEESSLIVSIGKWVLRTACFQNVAWKEQGLAPVVIAVTLTERQFSDANLLTDLKEILASTRMEARFLELEISESILMRDIGKTVKILEKLREVGVRIAIDNFGISYLSVVAQQKFPFDSIKIDQAFIHDLDHHGKTTTLTSSVIAIGKALSSTVVAQGVETKEQAAFLLESACNEYQGFYASAPLTSDQMTELLRAQKVLPLDS